MKVFEILLEMPESSGNIKHVTLRDEKPVDFKQTKDVLGKGAEATVLRGNDNNAIKIIDIPDTDDPTYQYIDMVMDNQDNPHFPRIHGAKLYENSEDTKSDWGHMTPLKLVINMEKLIPFNNDKVIHNLPILLQQLGISDRELGIQRDANGDIAQQDENSIDIIGNYLQGIFATPKGRAYLISKTQNKQLKEALQLTSNVLDNTKSRGDLYEYNVMLRLTGSGPQLVIVDPVVSVA